MSHCHIKESKTISSFGCSFFTSTLKLFTTHVLLSSTIKYSFSIVSTPDFLIKYPSSSCDILSSFSKSTKTQLSSNYIYT